MLDSIGLASELNAFDVVGVITFEMAADSILDGVVNMVFDT